MDHVFQNNARIARNIQGMYSNADDLIVKSENQEKVKKVMDEFEAGTLKTSAGETVTDRKQAIAIGLSEAGDVKKGEKDSEETPGFQKLEDEKVVSDNDEDNKEQDKTENEKEHSGVKKADVETDDNDSTDQEDDDVEKGKDLKKAMRQSVLGAKSFSMSAGELHNFRKNNIQSLYR